MTPSIRRFPKTPLALAALAALVLATGGAGMRAPSVSADGGVQRDTTVEMATGDRVIVQVRSMVRSGVELCAAVGPGVRGARTLHARSDGDLNGLATTVRFPASSSPQCAMHRHGGGDTVRVAFHKQVRDRAGRIGRLHVGTHALFLDRDTRRRITFRWVRDGADVFPAEALEEAVRRPR